MGTVFADQGLARPAVLPKAGFQFQGLASIEVGKM
jgi:hypothetical protein